MNVNEKLIRKTFDAMVQHRKGLNKFLIFDEDDEDEVDYRVLGDLLIKNFPWPIGIELRRLFSGSMREYNRMRLDQIFKTIERTMQFISFVMLSQLWKEKRQGGVEIPASFSRDFTSRFAVLSLGDYSWIIRSIVKIFEQNNLEWFLSEMGEQFDKKFLVALDFWVPERNDIGHYQINLTQEDIEKRLVEYEEKLTYLLKNISFLAKYKLVSVKQINVLKAKNQDAKFHHVMDMLNSSDSDFKAKELEEENYSDSNSVILMKSVKSIGEYINLSPLIIDTSGEIIDTKDKFKVKKDIFLYTKIRGDQLFYIGTEVTEKVDLRPLTNYDNLVREYKELVAAIVG